MLQTQSKSKKTQTFKIKALELPNKLLTKYRISNFDNIKIVVERDNDNIDDYFKNDNDIKNALLDISKNLWK